MKINIEERVERARTNFANGYNCSQSVAITFADIFDMDEKLIATISAPFGGGIGRLREVCGAVSGMSIIAGFISPANDPTDKTAKSANYALVQEFAVSFRDKNGSIVCRELLGLTPMANPPQNYKKLPCSELVALSTRIVAEYIASKESE